MNEPHQSYFFPNTLLGKWSVGLNGFFLGSVGISIVLVKGLELLSFGDRWWDITVPIIFSATIAAFVTGIRATRKYKETSVLVYVSVAIGSLSILFIFLHSLFIND
jgi:hypothetical protein